MIMVPAGVDIKYEGTVQNKALTSTLWAVTLATLFIKLVIVACF